MKLVFFFYSCHRSRSQHRKLLTYCIFLLSVSLLSFDHTYFVFWGSQHGKRSPRLKLFSLSINTAVKLIKLYILLPIPFLFYTLSSLPPWLSRFLPPCYSFTVLSPVFALLASLFLSVSFHSLSLPPLLLFLPFRSPSGSWSASWSTPGAAPWEEVVTTACASSSRRESAQRPPGSHVDWSRGTN